ncbi:amino acid ABC transporter permease [Treponema primitia]|uniref:amino acid ABC transporter permease n=1 Tax=Treponema primitia TaxID=88058 RepID=UPI00025558F3|nr:amino acid ABC transporter permease [Treponema primitia]
MAKLFDFPLVFTQIPLILEALPMTLALTILAFIGGLMVALPIAIVKMNKVPVLRQICAVFVSITRGTPVLVQLYLIYFGIPLMFKYINFYHGTNFNVRNVPSIVFALIALALNEAAYNSETIRAALQSVAKGQIEAAHSLGMTGIQTLKRVIIPQAFLIAMPPLGNSLIGLLKGTSLAFVCSLVEMTARGKILAGVNYRYFEAYCSLAIIYWVLTLAIEQGLRHAEKKLRIPDTAPPIVIGKDHI